MPKLGQNSRAETVTLLYQDLEPEKQNTYTTVSLLLLSTLDFRHDESGCPPSLDISLQKGIFVD
jgi:hypothetical protein